MTGSLQGKIAVITGGTQGLGAAIANEFKQAGAAGLILCGRNAEKGAAVADKLTGDGCVAHFHKTDLTNVDDCRSAIHKAEQHFGRIDVLVNAGAMTDRGSILDTSPELFDQIMATNVRGPFFLIQEAIKLMKKTEVKGSIVNICSMSGLTGQPFIAAYCTSKGALATLTRNTAYATVRNNIRVNALNIGWMASEGEDRIMKQYHGAQDDWLQKAAADLPFGRLIEPAEVARAVAFLASEQSGLMTGSVVNYDQSIWGGYDNPPAPASAL